MSSQGSGLKTDRRREVAGRIEFRNGPVSFSRLPSGAASIDRVPAGGLVGLGAAGGVGCPGGLGGGQGRGADDVAKSGAIAGVMLCAFVLLFVLLAAAAWNGLVVVACCLASAVAGAVLTWAMVMPRAASRAASKPLQHIDVEG